MFKYSLKSSLLLIMAVTFTSLKPIKIDRDNLFIPNKLGNIEVFHDKKGFSIKKDDKIYRVKNYFVDKEIRNLSDKQLMQFLGNLKIVEIDGKKLEFQKISKRQLGKIDEDNNFQRIKLDGKDAEKFAEAVGSLHSGYISINQMSDGEYALKANIRVLGGGPILALIAFWLTRHEVYILFEEKQADMINKAVANRGPGSGYITATRTDKLMNGPKKYIANIAGFMVALLAAHL